MAASDLLVEHELRSRLDSLTKGGEALENEGLPFPTKQIRAALDEALDGGDLETATTVLKRGEALLRRVSRDWTWLRELLRRADELRAIAGTIGVDLPHLDARVGNPRVRLRSEALSSGSMEKAAASASLALAVLNDAVPKFCLQEAQVLGESVRKARNRGEDVQAAARSFSRLIQAIQDQNLPTAAQRLVEARKMVARIPRAPALPAPTPGEEQEILLEARNLARRLQRIKGKARDAQSAARLMAQVRAALSEDRRFGSPEEEIEELWQQVEGMTKERKLASEIVPGFEIELPSAAETPPKEESLDATADELGDQEKPPPATWAEPTEPEKEPPSAPSPVLDSYVPPDETELPNGTDGDSEAAPTERPRHRPRHRT